MFWLQLTIYLILIAIEIAIIVIFGSAFLRGLPYAPTSRRAVERMVALAGVRTGMRIVDLGSGDGRIVFALARAGAEAHGIEMNRMLVWWSRMRARSVSLADRATFTRGDYTRIDLSPYDAVLVFGSPLVMQKLEEQFARQLRPGTVIVCNTHRLPTWTPERSEGKLVVYRVPTRPPGAVSHP